jgi:hypothetical protein
VTRRFPQAAEPTQSIGTATPNARRAREIADQPGELQFAELSAEAI